MKATEVVMKARFKLLYMTKLLTHKQFLKQKLDSFRIVESKTITYQLTKFNKIPNDW